MTSAAPKKIPTRIIDRTGKPAGYWLYRSPRENAKQYRPRVTPASDTRRNVNPYDRWEMVNFSRQLASRVPEIGGSIVQKNRWAFGDAWDAHYYGDNEAWGAEAKEFLDNLFFPNANLRGAPYDFRTSLFLSGLASDRDGDDAMLLTEDDNGFPKVAFVTAQKIMTRSPWLGAQPATAGSVSSDGITEIISGGQFDGAKIFDGIIFDRNNRWVGIRVVAEDGTPTDISSFNADLRYAPEWHDQGRGIPLLGRPLTKGMDFEDICEFLTRALKRASKWALTAKTRTGDAVEAGFSTITQEDVALGATASDPAGGSVTSRPMNIEEMDDGDILYLSTENDEAVEGIKFDSPQPNAAEFMTQMLRGILFSIGWPLELYNLGLSSRAPTRLLCDLANTTIWGQQSMALPRWRRAVIYALAKAMKNGFITNNDDFKDWSKWTPHMPKTMTVDAGNDFQAARDNVKFGISSKEIETQRLFGYHLDEVNRMNDKNFQALLKRTAEHVKFAKAQGIELPPEKIMELLEQHYPNPGSTPTRAAGDANNKATK